MKFFGKKRTEKKMEEVTPPESIFKAELENLTDELLEETIGPRGVLRREFDQRIARYKVNENPISPEEAEAMIHSLIRIAVAQRKCLNERIASSVEVGSLYQRYYGKVQAISESAIDTYIKMKMKDDAKREYAYYDKMYQNVRDNAYLDWVKPEATETATLDYGDILKAIDEAGGA